MAKSTTSSARGKSATSRKLLHKLDINGRSGLNVATLDRQFEIVAGESRAQVAVNSIMGHCDDSMAAVDRQNQISDQRRRDVTERCPLRNPFQQWTKPPVPAMMPMMSRISLELPTLQNWNCHNCSGCCRQHGIFITEEERRRIESQNWTADDGVPSQKPLFVPTGNRTGKHPWRLAQQADGACVFLDEGGLCRIHGKFGEAAKPLACRIYPYAFHPAGDKITVSLRFSCPSVAANRGTPVAAQTKELRELAARIVPANYRDVPPPKITDQTRFDWPDTLRIVRRLDVAFADERTPVVTRLLRTLFWIDLIDQTRFEKIRGARLEELLDLLTEAAVVEVGGMSLEGEAEGKRGKEEEGSAADAPSSPPPPGPSAVANGTQPTSPDAAGRPTKIGLSQFRLLAGQYARKDTFASARLGLAGRWRMLRAALRLTSGRGRLPALGDDLREVPFDALEQPFGVPDESEELFTRYYRVKIQGLHFCGRACYDLPLVEGWYGLALVYPVILWIARWRAVSQSRRQLTPDDVLHALMLVDHQHGYSDAFAGWSSRRRVRNLVRLGDLQRLLTWYSR